MFASSDCKDIGFRKYKFVAKTQFLQPNIVLGANNKVKDGKSSDIEQPKTFLFLQKKTHFLCFNYYTVYSFNEPKELVFYRKIRNNKVPEFLKLFCGGLL